MKISNEEMHDALKRSGYFLESRVLDILAKQGFMNFPNQTFPDPITNKSREIDIISKAQRITENLNLNFNLHFDYNYELIIECINNSQPVAFFKRPDKTPYTIFGKFYYVKIEREFLEPNDRGAADYVFNDFTTTSKEFHYNLFDLNTQYCSFSPKKSNLKEWMASHPDALHDTFGKLNNCIIDSTKSYEKWMQQSPIRDGIFTLFNFPVLILQNDLIEVSEINGKVEIEKKNHVVFEFNDSSGKKNGFLIDIITEEYLPEYLNIVKNSVSKLKDEIVKCYSGKSIVEFDYKKGK
jgi:hypothetical protein